ncbi:gluconate 2-dehydrogenase subunit 3 family protein [Pseudomonas mohnii]
MSKSPSRRHFLKSSLTLIPIVSIAPQSVLSASTDIAEKPPEASTTPPQPYTPHFFSEVEWSFVNAATAQLIPDDEIGPGAIACGVPEFIDRQMDTPYAHGALWYMQGPFLTDLPAELGYQQKLTPRDIYHFGIKACNEWCSKTKGKAFSNLSDEEKVKALHELEADAVPMDEMKSSLFFSQLLKNTKEGYFSDPIYGGNKKMAGWKMIGFPGARADYMDWIDHPNEKYPLGSVSIDGRRS